MTRKILLAGVVVCAAVPTAAVTAWSAPDTASPQARTGSRPTPEVRSANADSRQGMRRVAHKAARAFGALRTAESSSPPPSQRSAAEILRLTSWYKRRLGHAAADVRLVRAAGDDNIYVQSGDQVCLSIRASDRSGGTGCSPVASATDPTTPVGLGGYDDATGVATFTFLFVDGTHGVTVTDAGGGTHPVELVNNVGIARLEGQAATLTWITPDGTSSRLELAPIK